MQFSKSYVYCIIYTIILIIYIIGYASQPIGIIPKDKIYPKFTFLIPHFTISDIKKNYDFLSSLDNTAIPKQIDSSMQATLALCIIASLCLIAGIVLELLNYKLFSKILFFITTLLMFITFILTEVGNLQIIEKYFESKINRDASGYVLICTSFVFMLITFITSIVL